MDDFKKVKESYSKKFKVMEYINLNFTFKENWAKGFGSYTECMSRALFTGLSSFALSFSALYFTQVLLKSRLPYRQQYFLVLPSIVSTVVAWKVTSERTKLCQDAWVASETQYTSFDEKS